MTLDLDELGRIASVVHIGKQRRVTIGGSRFNETAALCGGDAGRTMMGAGARERATCEVCQTLSALNEGGPANG